MQLLRPASRAPISFIFSRVAEAPSVHVANNRLATSNDLLLCKNVPQSVADDSHGEEHLSSKMLHSGDDDDDETKREAERRQDQPETNRQEEENVR